VKNIEPSGKKAMSQGESAFWKSSALTVTCADATAYASKPAAAIRLRGTNRVCLARAACGT
jgi:hypothetical protein